MNQSEWINWRYGKILAGLSYRFLKSFSLLDAPIKSNVFKIIVRF